MDKSNVRPDDWQQRRDHLRDLSDEELKTRFWNLTEEVIAPMVRLAQTQTTPSIERSVLLRMGFSDAEAKAVVQQTIEHQRMGKGAGHCVYVLSLMDHIDIRTAGLRLGAGEGWERLEQRFGGIPR